MQGALLEILGVAPPRLPMFDPDHVEVIDAEREAAIEAYIVELEREKAEKDAK